MSCKIGDPSHKIDLLRNKMRCQLKLLSVGGATIAQWIRLRLPFCCPGFESQAHHLHFHQFIELYNVEKTKINKNRMELAHLKKLSV